MLLHLVRRLFPDTPAVFVDTGLEYPELREFVKTVDNVTWLKPEMNFRRVIATYGYPVISKEVSKRIVEYHNAQRKGTLEQSLAYQEFNGIRTAPNGDSYFNKKQWKFLLDAPFQMSHKCCDIMKKKPVKKYEKESGKFPIIGTMASESQARKTAWKIHGCNAFDATRPTSQPLSFWTEQDVLEYIQRYNLSYASVYGEIIKDTNGRLKTTKCNRTGCVFCAYGCHLEKEPNRFQQLKETHPKLWNYYMKPWNEGGLGMREVLGFIGVKVE